VDDDERARKAPRAAVGGAGSVCSGPTLKTVD